ncbi:hypothetical protein V5P93_004260 [Actinokineospora auranticolor]|uniref:PLAT/LH2 domain-containing protein n=1 Tax=Actinokineospora auranticolor TaxID=155976 RepID=A0A2S6GIF3_9PSEU|nr:hypothetical protein [Actinokineospora auranticolor]PPK64995.1 hypothetical protein CLV40_11637 [Actinokineospora auranticolor]
MDKKTVLRRVAAPVLAGAAIMVGVAGPASATPAHADAAGATLRSASITFTTLTDNKDFDTLVTVVVKDRDGRVDAQTSGFFGEFKDQTSKTLPLRIRTGATWDAIENGGSITVTIAPNGHDTWNFAYELDLSYSDGDAGFHLNPGTSLNEGRKSLTNPLN